MASYCGTSKAGLAALALGALVLGAALGPQTATGSPAEGKVFFSDARAQYEQGDFKLAAENFSTAFAMLPEVGDYALLHAAKAYLQGQMYSEVLTTVRRMYGKYPGSPLTRQARGIEVMARLSNDEPGALGALRKYVSDYPDDAEMKFLLAEMLKNHRLFDEAKEFFRELYVMAGPYSTEALAELEPGDLRAEDHLSHVMSLLEARDYPAAETVLRATLKDCPESLLDDVKGHLAHSLFSQRKYSEAAELYVELNDLYNAARAFIRTGNQQGFDSSLEKLVRRRDTKGADLMLAYSGELRRQGRTAEALKMLEDVRRKYPRRSEDAIWGIGWTHYITGGYAEAARLFRGLSSGPLNRDKYLYWQARALQRSGKDATKQFGRINGDGFYGLLSSMRTSVKGRSAVSSPKRMRAGGFRNKKRIDTLIAIGLKDEAADELVRVARKTRVYRNLRSIALRLVALKRYREAILITMSLPAGMQPVNILYPLAFWPKVNETARANGIDPFLILSLIREESRYDPEALSPAGAVGLMQLMPYTARMTARSIKVTVNGPESLMEAGLNITLGSRYLSGLLGEFKGVPHALAAYNAGEGRVRKWLKQTRYEDYDEFIEDIPFEETRNYVKRIVSTYYNYQKAQYPEFQHGRGIL